MWLFSIHAATLKIIKNCIFLQSWRQPFALFCWGLSSRSGQSMSHTLSSSETASPSWWFHRFTPLFPFISKAHKWKTQRLLFQTICSLLLAPSKMSRTWIASWLRVSSASSDGRLLVKEHNTRVRTGILAHSKLSLGIHLRKHDSLLVLGMPRAVLSTSAGICQASAMWSDFCN